MKTISSFINTTAIAIFVMLSCSCDSPNWETELSTLLQEERELHESYRNGELSKPEYSNSVHVVSQSAMKIITEHKEELFQKHIDALHEVEISTDIVDLISTFPPSEQQVVESFWNERFSDDDLIRMTPVGMSHVVLSRHLTTEEYTELQSFHLIALSDDECQTAMLYPSTIYTISFIKEPYCWTPIEVHKYERKPNHH